MAKLISRMLLTLRVRSCERRMPVYAGGRCKLQCQKVPGRPGVAAQRCSFLTRGLTRVLIFAAGGLLLVGCYFGARADDASPWPEAYLDFLTEMTYAQGQWNEDDFGRHVSERDRKLLNDFRPRIHIFPGEFYPIDFYEAYLPRTVVKNAKGAIKKVKPEQKYLKRIERQHGRYLDYTGDFERLTLGKEIPSDAVLYPSVHREDLTLPDQPPTPVMVLKYSAVFAASGLPRKLGWFRELISHLLGTPRIWHELDIHGAVHIILNESSLTPIIVLLAQHNHFRTFLVGKDIQWPDDNRLSVSYALRSNEPYLTPLAHQAVHYPTAGDPSHFRFILTGKHKPLTGGYDVVHGPNAGAVQVPYRLEYLKTRDPLYTSWISLGDRLKLFGLFPSFFRHGPPGIDINTHPQIKKYTDTAAAYYVSPEDDVAVELFESHIKGLMAADYGPVLEYNKSLLSDLLRR